MNEMRLRRAGPSAVFALTCVVSVAALTVPAQSETPGQNILVSTGTTETGLEIDSGLIGVVNGDGTVVAFTQLRIGNDETPQINAVVRDRTSDTVQVIAGTAIDGVGGAALVHDLTSDGRYIALSRSVPGVRLAPVREITVYDRDNDLMSVVISAASQSALTSAVISDDGRFVAFQAAATTTTAAVAVDPSPRVIVMDRGAPDEDGIFTGDPELLADIENAFDPSISGDGKWIAFSRLEPAGPVIQLQPGPLQLLPLLPLPFPTPTPPIINLRRPASAVQSLAPIASAFVRSIESEEETELTPDLKSGEFAIQTSISADGRFVALTLGRTGSGQDQTHVLRFDRDTDDDGNFDEVDGTESAIVSEPLVDDLEPEVRLADSPAISDDGNTVAFVAAGGLVLEDTDLDPGFLNSGIRSGAVANVFQSSRTGSAAVNRIVTSATLSVTRSPLRVDVYALDVAEQHLGRISVGPDDSQVRTGGDTPSVSSFGRFVAFHATDVGEGPTLVDGDDDSRVDVFLRDRIPILVVEPNPSDFGVITQGGPPVENVLTVTNIGLGPARIPPNGITVSPDDIGFSVVSHDCGEILRREQTCSVLVSFDPVIEGVATSSLLVANDSPVDPVTARLRALVEPGLDPILEIDPEVGPDGFVPIASGFDFPPGEPVLLQWKLDNDEPSIEPAVQVFADANGEFEVGVLVFPNSFTGERTLEALIEGETELEEPPMAEYLVTQNTADPFSDGDSLDWFRG